MQLKYYLLYRQHNQPSQNKRVFKFYTNPTTKTRKSSIPSEAKLEYTKKSSNTVLERTVKDSTTTNQHLKKAVDQEPKRYVKKMKGRK